MLPFHHYLLNPAAKLWLALHHVAGLCFCCHPSLSSLSSLPSLSCLSSLPSLASLPSLSSHSYLPSHSSLPSQCFFSHPSLSSLVLVLLLRMLRVLRAADSSVSAVFVSVGLFFPGLILALAAGLLKPAAAGLFKGELLTLILALGALPFAGLAGTF